MIRNDLFWKKEEEGYVFYDGDKKIKLDDWNKKINSEHLPSHVIENKNPIIRFEESRRRKRIINMILKSSPRVVADIGSANGFISKHLTNHCHKLYCVDIDPKMLDLAKKEVNHKNAEFIQSDAENIKLEDNSADVSFAAHLLEHLPNPRKGLEEMVRITKPNGSIILNLPNEKVVLFLKNILKKTKMTFLLGGDFRPELAPAHLHVFDKRLLKKISQGIAKIEEVSYNPPLYTFMYARLKPLK